MKKFLINLLIITGFAASWLFITSDERLPELKNGDLLFQTASSDQAAAIMLASASLYTHTGIVKKSGDGWVVVEATSKVEETPLAEWIGRGMWDRVAIYRDVDLTQAQAETILESVKRYYGKRYDLFFSFDNDMIYCSELPYLAFREAGVPIGKVQRVGDLNADNWLVREIIEKRWKHYDACTERGYDFSQCYDHIMDQQLITPAALARDVKLQKIYTNYLF